MDIDNTTSQDNFHLRQIHTARLIAEDEVRRLQPCARCRQPIGSTATYIRHLDGLTDDPSRQYMHRECRCCELCEEVITGEYVEMDVKQQLAPTIRAGGLRVYSQPHYLERVYYHAACAHRAGIMPTSTKLGGLNPEYGFFTRSGDECVLVDFE